MMEICEAVNETQQHGCDYSCSCQYPAKANGLRGAGVALNACGILVAVAAAYMIVSADSSLYLGFWVCYSVLRRMTRSKPHAKTA